MSPTHIWKNGQFHATTLLQTKFDNELGKLHTLRPSAGEINRLKQLHAEDFLAALEHAISAELDPKYRACIFSGYIDHYPRAFSDGIDREIGVELADLVLLRTFYEAGHIERRAVLMQAKAFLQHEVPAVPTGTNTEENDPAQRELLENLPSFVLRKKATDQEKRDAAKKGSVPLGQQIGSFDIKKDLVHPPSSSDKWQHSRYLLVAKENSVQPPQLAPLPPGALWWSAVPTANSGLNSFASTLASFVTVADESIVPDHHDPASIQDIPVGRDFTIDTTSSMDWDRCITNLLQYCSERIINKLLTDQRSGLLGSAGALAGDSEIPSLLSYAQQQSLFAQSFIQRPGKKDLLGDNLRRYQDFLSSTLNVMTLVGLSEPPPNEPVRLEEENGAGMHFIHIAIVEKDTQTQPKI